MILIFVDEMNMWTCGLISIVCQQTIEMILIFVHEMNMWTCGLISIVHPLTIEMILMFVDEMCGHVVSSQSSVDGRLR
jgi:hypothetical protein